MERITFKKCSAIIAGFNKDIDILASNGESYIVNRKDYHNDGIFDGYPLYIGGSHLFRLLGGSHSLSDILSGKVDWSARKEWLNCFTEEEIKEAINVEKTFRSWKKES